MWDARSCAGPCSSNARRFSLEAGETVTVIGVLTTLLRDLGGLVTEEVRVGAPFQLRVPLLLVRVGTQHINEEVRGAGALNRVCLGQGRRSIAARHLEHADMVACVWIEGGELGIRAEGHGEKEPHTVLLPGFS